MKNLIYIFLLAAVFAACRKDDSKPANGTVDERVEASMTAYQTQLASAKFGWKGFLNTGSNGVYTFLFNFNDKNRVTMSSDYDPAALESSYRLKALQQPSLLFDTYSTLHKLQDPDPSKFNGAPGAGKGADFEFRFVSATADTIKLEGLFNQTPLILVRSASQEENKAVFPGITRMKTVLANLKTYFKRVTIAGTAYEVRFDIPTSTISFSSYENGVRKTVTSGFYTDGTRIAFFTPLVLGNTVLSELKDVNMDSGAGIVNATALGAKVQFTQATAPLVYDKTVVDFFMNNPSNLGLYWDGSDGFTISGVQDAYNLKGNIPGFAGLYFFPKLSLNGAPTQTFRFYSGTTGYTGYLLAYPAVKIQDGKILFNATALYNSTTNTKIRTAQVNTALILQQPEGFYLINTGLQKYDLVNVKDATAWMSFR